jgi:hypothetical protein
LRCEGEKRYLSVVEGEKRYLKGAAREGEKAYLMIGESGRSMRGARQARAARDAITHAGQIAGLIVAPE